MCADFAYHTAAGVPGVNADGDSVLYQCIDRFIYMGDQDGTEIMAGNNVYADVIAASPCTTGEEFEWTYDSYWGEWYCPGYCYTADKITDPDDADLCLDDCEHGYTECVEGDDCYVADSIFGKCNATGEWDS
jgi:hypothetical protein